MVGAPPWQDSGMNLLIRNALALVLVASLSGCFRATIRSSAPEARASSTKIGVTWLYGVTPVDDRAPECEHGIASATTQMPFWGGVIMVLTAGLVAPMSIDYVCAEPRSDDRR